MKLVVASDFCNVAKLELKPVSGAPHEDHVPKGARIEIGDGDDLTQLPVKDQENIANLFHAGRIVSADNVKGIKLIDAEVEMEKKRLAKLEDATKKAAAPAGDKK